MWVAWENRHLQSCHLKLSIPVRRTTYHCVLLDVSESLLRAFPGGSSAMQPERHLPRGIPCPHGLQVEASHCHGATETLMLLHNVGASLCTAQRNHVPHMRS